MSAKNKLDFLKAAFDKKTGGGDQSWKLFFPFWKAPDDSTTIVRFLPDLDDDNSLGFLVENLQHELVINGQKKKVPCLAMHGENCPICELSRKYYDDGNEDMGKKYYKKKSYIGQVIVIETPVEHDQSQLVKLIEFGPAVFKQIQAAFQSGDLEEAPYELKGGYNFRIKKTKSGQYASYSTSSFSPKRSDLDDDVIESLQLFNLADYRGKKIDRTSIGAMLIADQTGQPYGVDEGEDSPAPAAKTSKPAPKADEGEDSPAPAPTAKAEPAAAPAAGGKSGDVLARLRARAAAAKTEE